MAKTWIENVKRTMKEPESIRNISVIAHVDHGKSTLTDSLIAKAGIIGSAKAGELRALDTRKDEQKRGITIKSTSVSLYYERNAMPYVINVIDSPGHVDFSSEVSAALRVTDGALVVVDCVEGVCVQTETVLRQAISERIKPVLFLNKLDRVFLELQCTPDECYNSFRNSIESVNVVCQTYSSSSMASTTSTTSSTNTSTSATSVSVVELSPEKGNVGFGSGLHAWGFTLRDFAQMYASKFGVKTETVMSKLWGENYWNPKERRWVQSNNEKGTLIRGFCQFVLHPIKAVCDGIMKSKGNGKGNEEYKKIVKALGMGVESRISKKDLDECMKPKDVLKLVMRSWLPAGNALLDMIVDHLPSPATAQKYRVDMLYSGALDSNCAQSIRNCDPKGPLGVYISKMVPSDDNSGRFVAFGRVFSGIVRAGTEVFVSENEGINNSNSSNSSKKLAVKRKKKIQRVLLMMGRYKEALTECPAGNVCGIQGVDDCLVKSGTLTNSAEFSPFVTMQFSVAAIVQKSVEVKKASDLPKLVEGLKRLAKADSLVKVSMSKTGQHIVAGAGELHLEICLNDLKNDFMNGAPIVVSEPIVSLAETIVQKTGDDGKHPKTCIAKSPNKHNRLYMHASPLSEEIVTGIESGSVSVADMNAQKMFGGNKVWSFGCAPDGLSNCVVDCTKGVQYMNEVSEHVVSALAAVSNEGVLCGEPMRGIGFEITDAKLISDGTHRGAAAMIPCAKKAFYACELASGPRLLEPTYLVDISVPISEHSGVYRTLNAKRGSVQSVSEQRVGSGMTQIRAYLPVLESFGFTQLLRSNTGGKAFPQMQFSHWSLCNGNPMEKGSAANKLLLQTRERKGMKVAVPVFSDYHARL